MNDELLFEVQGWAANQYLSTKAGTWIPERVERFMRESFESQINTVHQAYNAALTSDVAAWFVIQSVDNFSEFCQLFVCLNAAINSLQETLGHLSDRAVELAPLLLESSDCELLIAEATDPRPRTLPTEVTKASRCWVPIVKVHEKILELRTLFRNVKLETRGGELAIDKVIEHGAHVLLFDAFAAVSSVWECTMPVLSEVMVQDDSSAEHVRDRFAWSSQFERPVLRG